MIQVNEIVKQAFAMLNVFGYQENPDFNSSTLALNQLKYMLDEWSIRYFTYKKFEALVTAKQGILLGTDTTNPLLPVSGDYAERPASINQITFESGGINYDLAVKTYEEYRQIQMQNVFGIPDSAYVLYDMPYVTIYFYPSFGVAGNIRIIGRDYMTDDDIQLSTYLDVPREFVTGIISNLALQIAPMFGVTPPQDLIIRASATIRHIKHSQLMKNVKRLKSDFNDTNSRGNWRTGYV